MAFNPYGTIYLCNVPFDSTYKNVVIFDSLTAQRNYFTQKTLKTFTNYLTVRETLPDGSLRSYVKVNMNIDDLRALNVNYMYYQNSHSTTKYFYCFITQLIYINEDTTKIIFDTDVYQTWMFDVEIKQSYVAREHSETDNYGDNTIPESFDFSEFVYESARDEKLFNEWGYLAAVSKGYDDDETMPVREYSGIYQGLRFYYFGGDGKLNDLNVFITDMEEQSGESIQFITVIPKLYAPLVTETLRVESSSKPFERTISFDRNDVPKNFEGYEPKNRKLFTAPYCTLAVSNNSGTEIAYSMEDFATARVMSFTVYGDISASPSCMLVPLDYRGVEEAIDFGISLSGFPQISVVSDSFKIWLSKNQAHNELSLSKDVAMLVTAMGGLLAAPSGGTSLAVAGSVLPAVTGMGMTGASTMMGFHALNGILGTFADASRASKQPNGVRNGGGNNLLTAMKENDFRFYWRKVKKKYAIMIDNFFTMYGYQTNALKIPNTKKRPYFNYVQTMGINIVGGIPDDDMKILKNIYDSGVTIWKPNATIGDYSVYNGLD